MFFVLDQVSSHAKGFILFVCFFVSKGPGCRQRETLQYLCEQIPGDALLYSMFKENAEPVKCPLKGNLIGFTSHTQAYNAMLNKIR